MAEAKKEGVMNQDDKKYMDFPLFDAHMHYPHAYLDQVLEAYEECGVKAGINLWLIDFNGGYHSNYEEFLVDCNKRGLGNRFIQFFWPEWKEFGWNPDGFVKHTCSDMRRYAALGVRGMKVWKDIGMFNFFADGTPVYLDDERFIPVWKTVRELGWTISLHTADPSSHFNPRTKASRELLFEKRDKVIAANPDIPFILCHSANYIEDVKKFAALLDRFPNVDSDLSQLENLGTDEQLKWLFERYSGRLYFGPDIGMPDNRPPDRKWNLEEGYLPWRKKLVDLGLTEATFKKITWENGAKRFL